MKEVKINTKQRMEEASKDKEWAKKVRNSGSLEVYTKLLKEKGIDVPEEIKRKFTAGNVNKTGILEDNDLELVTGGWDNVFNCPKSHNLFLCDYTFCPHIQDRDHVPDEQHYERYCDQGHWSEIVSYPGKI